MAKKRRRKPQSQRPQAGQQPRRQAPRPAAPPEDATEVLLDAMTAAESRGAVADDPASTAEPATKAALGTAIAEAQAARTTYVRLNADIEEEKSALAVARAELDAEKEDVDRSRAALSEDEAAIAEMRREVQELKERQSARREELAELASAAEDGFLARREEILGPVKDRIAELTASWHTKEEELIARWDDELRRRSEEVRGAVAEQWRELEDQRTSLSATALDHERREGELARRQMQLEAEEQVLNEDRESLERQRQEIAERAAAEATGALQAAQARADRLQERVDVLERDQSAVEQLRKELGDDPAAIASAVNELRDRLRASVAELSSRPTVDVRDERDAALQRIAEAEGQRTAALREQRELEQRLAYQEQQISEVEQLRMVHDTREAVLAAYSSEIEELTARFEQLTADADRQGAFPSCRNLDRQFGGRAAAEGRVVDDLKGLATELRYRMADYPDAQKMGKRLNYRPRDVRVLLAGLAMSRLHLLEGVSGTGKTTLPHALAAAVGGGVRKIEIQAGWRDKQDLLGYYNSFERVYRETAFLQYLYKACLPPFEDRLLFIVLDEMNLSHPEQYFADFLSALEDPKERPLISIADRELPDVPDRFVTDSGIQLPLAPNVWFVGTANQDETTFSFAPKTYDRAHVMELEPHAPGTPPTPEEIDPERLISYSGLQALFGHAAGRHRSEAEEAIAVVHRLLDFFQEQFHVGWGERMDLQIRRFVPVDVAAGGSLGEGLDHIVATKVLRKIRGLHSVRKNDLEQLEKLIVDSWPAGEAGPKLSLQTLQRERRALDF